MNPSDDRWAAACEDMDALRNNCMSLLALLRGDEGTPATARMLIATYEQMIQHFEEIKAELERGVSEWERSE